MGKSDTVDMAYDGEWGVEVKPRRGEGKGSVHDFCRL